MGLVRNTTPGPPLGISNSRPCEPGAAFCQLRYDGRCRELDQNRCIILIKNGLFD